MKTFPFGGMKFHRIITAAVGIFVLLSSVASSKADTFGSGGDQFTINFVSIGNAGNANDTTRYGGVSYDYNMAVTDVSETMLEDAAALSGTNLDGGAWSGSQPAADVTWYEAAAFVNWLNTSQGYTAAYDLTYSGNTPNGITLWTPGSEWTMGGTDYFRNANAHYFLPSENEWYKAAFYSPSGVYYAYADGSNTPPTAVASGTAAGTAVYNGVASQPAAVDQSGGLSPYGTQGQTGNIYQWLETDYSDPTNSSDGARVLRGGEWGSNNPSSLSRTLRFNDGPTTAGPYLGFRVASVASVPEPNSIMLMLAGVAGLALIRRKPFDL